MEIKCNLMWCKLNRIEDQTTKVCYIDPRSIEGSYKKKDKIVQLFLHGDPLLSHEINVDIISLAQSFIEDSKRFNMRILQ